MREPPVDLPDQTIRAALHTAYGLDVADLEFLPLGHDAWAWVYRVRTNQSGSYFLKIRRQVINEPGLLVPHYLQEHGVTQCVAPLQTIAGTLWAELNNYSLILYPFIESNTGKDHGMTPQQWVAYGSVLRQIHNTAVDPDLAQLMRHETFEPTGISQVRDVEVHVAGKKFSDSSAQELATFWRERSDDINFVVEGVERLGRQMAKMAPDLVLCHADIHTANLLLDASGALWIVDWDETVLAPKERDLMFVVGGGISRSWVSTQDEELFLQGYGSTSVDPVALAYYRYAWAVNDIGEYGAQVFFRPELGLISQRAAIEEFKGLFHPGNIVALSMAIDIAALLD